jgi:hypothetical protein
MPAIDIYEQVVYIYDLVKDLYGACQRDLRLNDYSQHFIFFALCEWAQ